MTGSHAIKRMTGSVAVNWDVPDDEDDDSLVDWNDGSPVDPSEFVLGEKSAGSVGDAGPIKVGNAYIVPGYKGADPL